MVANCLLPKVFNALPRHKKAVLVAKDVLAQITAEQMDIQCGSYISGELSYPDGVNQDTIAFIKLSEASTASQQGRELIQNSYCTVCAKGAMFMSSVMRSNKMSIGEVADIIDMNKEWYTGVDVEDVITHKVCKKDGIFLKNNFNLIEAAFERSALHYDTKAGEDGGNSDAYYDEYGNSDYEDKKGDNVTVKTAKAAVRFGSEYPTAKIRLAAICLNIIANNGEFNPFKHIPTSKEADKAITPVKKKKK
jgi:hypothetical protein